MRGADDNPFALQFVNPLAAKLAGRYAFSISKTNKFVDECCCYLHFCEINGWTMVFDLPSFCNR